MNGICVICGKETNNFCARIAPLSGIRLVLKNEKQEIIAETSEITNLPGWKYRALVLFVCEDHNHWISVDFPSEP